MYNICQVCGALFNSDNNNCPECGVEFNNITIKSDKHYYVGKPHEVLINETSVFDVKSKEEVIVQRNITHRLVIIITIAVILVGSVFGYFKLLNPYILDKKSPRYYINTNSTFLRSTMAEGSNHNKITELTFGSEIIRYKIEEGWAKVKYKDPVSKENIIGYINANHILSYNEFRNKEITKEEAIIHTQELNDKGKEKSKAKEYTSYYVTEKVFFHDNATNESKRMSFLLANDVIYIEKTNKNFGYTEYTNNNGIKTNGWIKTNNLQENLIAGKWIVKPDEDLIGYGIPYLELYPDGKANYYPSEDWMISGLYQFNGEYVILSGKPIGDSLGENEPIETRKFILKNNTLKLENGITLLDEHTWINLN